MCNYIYVSPLPGEQRQSPGLLQQVPHCQHNACWAAVRNNILTLCLTQIKHWGRHNYPPCAILIPVQCVWCMTGNVIGRFKGDFTSISRQTLTEILISTNSLKCICSLNLYYSTFAGFIPFMSTCLEFYLNFFGPFCAVACRGAIPRSCKAPLNLNACTKFHMVLLFGYGVNAGIRSRKDSGSPDRE